MLATTLHAKFRYATRILDMNIKDENIYKAWQKKNEEEYKRIKEEILELANKSELVYIGKIGENTNDDCRYYVDLNNMITFVTDAKGEVVITCYDIFFDMGKDIDRQTVKILLKEINRLQKQKEKDNLKIGKYLESVDFEINTTENEMQRIENILNNLNSKLKKSKRPKEN